MTEGELLQRIASTLRQEIGPAIEAEYPKTQAFMAGVVLQKLGQQLALSDVHTAAETVALDALLQDLEPLLSTGAPVADVNAARARLTQSRDAAALSHFIAALYAGREALGEVRFTQVLGRVRQTLRGSLDRRMEYAA